MRMRVVVVLVIVVYTVATAHVMMMRLLGRTGIGFVADDLRAVLAELAVHSRIAACDLSDALNKGVEQQRVISQVGRLDEFDLGVA